VAARRGLDAEPFVPERHGDQLGDVGFVVDYENTSPVLIHNLMLI
jgi:hypothetical protein